MGEIGCLKHKRTHVNLEQPVQLFCQAIDKDAAYAQLAAAIARERSHAGGDVHGGEKAFNGWVGVGHIGVFPLSHTRSKNVT